MRASSGLHGEVRFCLHLKWQDWLQVLYWLHSNCSPHTEKWTEKPNMSPTPVGRRDPRKEAEAGALNLMETWTKDTGCLSATSRMTWNGKPWKISWKIKVRCWLASRFSLVKKNRNKKKKPKKHTGSFCVISAHIKVFSYWYRVFTSSMSS